METEFKGSRLVLALHEVRAMGCRVAWWRVRYELRKRLGRLTRPEPLDVDDPSAVCAAFTDPPSDPAALVAKLRDEPAGRFFLDRCEPSQYIEAIRAHCHVAATTAAADEAMAHRFTFMDRTWDFGDGEIDWHRDPESGKSWPRLQWSRMDIRSDRRLGDVKFIWELNRCQFWPTLGRAYWLTADERYAAEWVAQFESWCEQNPPEIGVNWYSNLEHALRLVSWWTAAKFMLHSPSVPAEVFTRLIGLLIAKCRHIVTDLDYSMISIANNHLIGDAMGLAFIGMALPELREAAAWRDLGLKILWTEAPKQIYADGSSFECASSYHRFVLHFYLTAIIMADLNDVEVPAEARRRVEGMAEFVHAAMRSDGTLPQFGDCDNGLGYRLSDAAVQDFRPVLSTAAILFDRPDFKAAAGSLDAETIWMLGPEAAEKFNVLGDHAAESANVSFPEGGYFMARRVESGGHVFVQNTPFTSHTHADLLSFTWHLEGRPLLVDTGTFTYNGDWDWRTSFRGTAAHNTVKVDRRNQALAHRPFRWLFPPKARNNFYADEGRFCYDGEHSGYRKLGVTHRRVLLELTGRALLCIDVLTGRKMHEVQLNWCLAPDLTVTPVAEGPRITAQRDGVDVMSLTTCASAELAVDVACGRTDPPAGWYSVGYGAKQPSVAIAMRTHTEMPFVAATVAAAADQPIRPISVTCRGKDVHVVLDDDGETVTVDYRLMAPSSRGGEDVELGEIAGAGGSREPIIARRVGS